MKKRRIILFYSLIKGRFLWDNSILFLFSVISFKGQVRMCTDATGTEC